MKRKNNRKINQQINNKVTKKQFQRWTVFNWKKLVLFNSPKNCGECVQATLSLYKMIRIIPWTPANEMQKKEKKLFQLLWWHYDWHIFQAIRLHLMKKKEIQIHFMQWLFAPSTFTVFVAFALCDFNGSFSCNMRYQEIHEDVFAIRWLLHRFQ